jgi:WD40 repeat protein
MKARPEDSPSRELRLEAALARYYTTREAGREPDREALLRSYPDLEGELRRFFQNDALLAGAGKSPAFCGDAVDPFAPRSFGGYELLDELARGGMGVVYRARQASLGRTVALKVLIAGSFATRADLERFRLEAQAAARLDHPGIVPIHEIGEAEGRPYFTMKFIEGGSLAERLPELRGEHRRIAGLLAKVARAVHHAHQEGVIHRDLKPGNILLDPSGEPYVTDFGLAKHHEQGEESLTQTGAVVGTPGYMSPEQAAGKKRAQLTPAADIYSLGAILYELLAGRPPFQGESTVETLRQVVEDSPRRPSQIAAGVPRDLETICLHALEKDPRRRFGSALAFAEDLERWLAGEPIAARCSGVWERGLLWARRRPMAAGLVALSIVFLVALAGAWELYGRMHARSEADHARDEDRDRRRIHARRMRHAYDTWQQKLKNSAELLRQLDLEGGAEDLKGFEFRHLWLQQHKDVATLHAAGIYDCGVTPDRSRIVVHTETGLFLLDAADLQIKARIRFKERECWVILSPSGKLCTIEYFSDGEARIWNTSDGTLKADLRGHQGPVRCAGFSPDERFAVTGSEDGTVRVWSLETSGEVAVLRGHESHVLGAIFTPDDRQVISGARDGLIRIWDWRNQKEIRRLEGHRAVPAYLTIAAEGSVLVSLGEDRRAIFWDLPEGRQLAELAADQESTSTYKALAIAPDASRVARRLAGGAVEISAIPGKQKLAELPGEEQAVSLVTFPWNGHRLVTVLADGTVKVWDGATGRRLVTLPGHETPAVDAEMSADNGFLATVTPWHLKLWRLPLEPEPEGIVSWGGVQAVCTRDAAHVNGLAFDPGSRFLVTKTVKGSFRAWDLEDWKRGGGVKDLGEMKAAEDGFFLGAIAKDATRIASAKKNGTLVVERVSLTGPAPALELEARLEWPGKDLWGPLAFSPDGKSLVAMDKDGSARVWRRSTASAGAASWSAARDFQFPLGQASDLTMSLDGRLLVIGRDHDPRVFLWDLETGKQLGVLEGHLDWPVAFAFSPDSSLLATAGLDFSVRLWDVSPGKVASGARPLRVMTGHHRTISALAFTPDRRTLISVADVGGVKFWDPVIGEERGTLQLEDVKRVGIHCAGISPDGSILAIGGSRVDHGKGGRVDLLRAASEEEIAARAPAVMVPAGK